MIQLKIALCLAGLVQLSFGQQAGWRPGQVNTTMCQWYSPRTGVIRDTLYIDGGNLLWEPGMSDGTYGSPISDGNPLGLVYLLNFSIPFNTSQNTTSIFTTISKAAGNGAVNNLGPQYYDGAMFANDYEWMTFGGLPEITDSYNPQPSSSVAAYDAYPQGVKQFTEGYILDSLPDGMNRYVTDGASVSIPSENLGFYFGGMRSASWGPIYYLPGSSNESLNADQLSLTLIEVDMSVQYKEQWYNYTLPDAVPGRADAELVWVPVSKQGVLVAIGGVIFPSYMNPNQTNNASATALSQAKSPGFMTTVSVYDIASHIWYEQPTTGSAPGQLTQGCTVLASAQDGSSHNIYWYGGFDGLDATGTFNDNVYVLSVPSFIWTKVSTSSTPSHGRAGHRCTKPYPDQMFVIGGYSSLSGDSINCVDGGIVQIYNLSSNTWLDSYNPEVWGNYSVPAAVFGAIGGTATGGATQKSPSPSGFANANMTALFGTSYNATKITNWYPYTPAAASPTASRSVLPTTLGSAKPGTPSYLAPVLGVVLGLFFITLIILAILLWRRRKYLRSSNGAQSEAGTMDNRRWVDRWLSGTPSGAGPIDTKAPTITTDDTPMSPYDEAPDVPEMDQGIIRYEMDATDKPLELHNQEMQSAGMIPLSALSIGGSGVVHSNSHASHTSNASSVSGTSMGFPLANSPLPSNPRIVSGVSNVSETDRGHLRGISNTSVSTYGTPSEGLTMNQGYHTAPAAMERAIAVSPLTPPSATVPESMEYLRATTPRSPNSKRKSNFSEGLDEMENR